MDSDKNITWCVGTPWSIAQRIEVEVLSPSTLYNNNVFITHHPLALLHKLDDCTNTKVVAKVNNNTTNVHHHNIGSMTMLLLNHVPIKLQTLVNYAYEIEIQHSLVRWNPTSQLQTIEVVVLSPFIYRPFITITYSSSTTHLHYSTTWMIVQTQKLLLK